MASAISSHYPENSGILSIAGLLTCGSLYSLFLPIPCPKYTGLQEQWLFLRFHPRSQRRPNATVFHRIPI